MEARFVFNQNNGDVTKAYYADMNSKGVEGELAVALFRAQKRSTAAKRYRGRKHTRSAYDVKNWSLGEVCRILGKNLGIEWGWKYDAKAVNFEWVLYMDLPQGQCSFHSPDRLTGPDYTGTWKPAKPSYEVIIEYCDSISGAYAILKAPEPTAAEWFAALPAE